ncbi:IS110 family transposase [Pseudomonas gingeri]|uniref:IS110 family transposase n=2 Tax=Gammaproteobacteria TaxID=1236 RepID=UPI0015A101AE|nr:IS110 family transposase [Pseudomonas gingeri]NWA05507.1 IS110 family transposase [Pseudomonas gingeri]NWA17184.1 IS110 family transposase [Pseudomonas gingeri]NWA59089.1 IS110 family transposase [Pseudomonas gingeri]NWA99694.1 IS110 family transposase [Pseudomonas gingeri]NWB03345.1 IS110 family transposase [Pseudomonas gingeri]
MSACTTVAVDLAKRVFQVAGEDALGQVLYEERIKSREAFYAFLRKLPPTTVVLMETGPGAQAWARQLQAQGNLARILPAQHVADHRSGAKNDRNDALAILRAGRDTRILAVPIKSAAALAMQALHRARQGYVRRRTAMSNQMRGLLLEHGVALAQGDVAISQTIPRILEDATQPLPDMLRELIDELLGEWRHLGERINVLTGRLEAAASADKTAKRLMTVRGIGPIIATALLAKQTQPERFADARQFAAYFGMVPDQHSSGEKVRMGKMSKRGDRYVSSLMIQGAHAVLRQMRPDSEQPDDRRLQRWVSRLGRKEAAVRLANRNLRIVWVLLQNEQTYRRQPGNGQEAAVSH